MVYNREQKISRRIPKETVKTTLIIVAVAVLVQIVGYLFVQILFNYNPIVDREVITSAEQYEKYLGENGKYKNNYVAYNDIWPDSIKKDACEVKNFYYEYFNPWDACFLGYMTIDYSNSKKYEEEINRLSEVSNTDYVGIYGMDHFSKDLCAIYANESGMIYALTEKDKQEIVYVSLEFCNFFTDISYKKHIEKEDLPVGMDISDNNPSREKYLKELE